MVDVAAVDVVKVHQEDEEPILEALEAAVVLPEVVAQLVAPTSTSTTTRLSQV